MIRTSMTTVERPTSGAGLESIRERIKRDADQAAAGSATSIPPALPSVVADALLRVKLVDPGAGQLLKVGVADKLGNITIACRLHGYQQLQEFQAILELAGLRPQEGEGDAGGESDCDFVFAPAQPVRPGQVDVKLHTRKARHVPADEADEQVLHALHQAAESSADTAEAILVGVCNEAGAVYRTAVLMSSEQHVRAAAGLAQLGYREVRSLGQELPQGFDAVFARP